MSQRQSGPRAHLALDPCRKLDGQSRRHEAAFPWSEDKIRLCGGQIETRGAGRPPRRQRQIGVVGKAKDAYLAHARNADGSAYSIPNASATPGYVTFPSIMFSPLSSDASSRSACFHPFFASLSA